MDLTIRDTIILAIMVLFLGKALNRRIPVLRDYNIHEPVTGGILASLNCVAWIISQTFYPIPGGLKVWHKSANSFNYQHKKKPALSGFLHSCSIL